MPVSRLCALENVASPFPNSNDASIDVAFGDNQIQIPIRIEMTERYVCWSGSDLKALLILETTIADGDENRDVIGTWSWQLLNPIRRHD